MHDEKKKQKDIGALWEKTTQSGKRLLSGTIEIDGKKTRIVAWANTFKQPGERSPDWRIQVDTFEPKPKQHREEAFTGTPADPEDF